MAPTQFFVLLAALLAPVVFASPLESRQTSTPPPVFRTYRIHNKCPAAVNLYAGGSFLEPLPLGASSVTKSLDINLGPFYISRTADAPTSLDGLVEAGFYGNDGYYIVRDPNHITAGVSVTPSKAEFDGFCPTIQCDSANCSAAFPQPPTGFPDVAPVPPTAPYFRCPAPDLSFDVTFCPSGQFPDSVPASTVTAMHPNFNTNKCIDVRGATFANGTPVQIYDCNGSAAQNWVVKKGAASTSIQVAGTNFCLDAGSSPANGVGLKIWQCYDNLPAQTWKYTSDNRLTLASTDFCADLTDGKLANSNQLQTWQCSANNNNQVWTI